MFALKKTIYFTGFMASGKSRIGRSIAERLHATFVDTDALIVERQGKSISEIFEEEGETAFRKMELQVIREIAEDMTPKVVALGGGTLTQPSVVSLIRQTGLIVGETGSPFGTDWAQGHASADVGAFSRRTSGKNQEDACGKGTALCLGRF